MPHSLHSCPRARCLADVVARMNPASELPRTTCSKFCTPIKRKTKPSLTQTKPSVTHFPLNKASATKCHYKWTAQLEKKHRGLAREGERRQMPLRIPHLGFCGHGFGGGDRATCTAWHHALKALVARSLSMCSLRLFSFPPRIARQPRN